MNIPWIEWVGYVASIMIVISLIMTSVVSLRIVNTIGCILFVIYGLTTGAYPVAIANSLIVFINFYHLYRLKIEAESK